MTDQQADDVIAQAKKAAVAIEAYVVMNGPEHDEDCPADDTCDCEMKWINDAMNAAPKLLAALVERVTRQPQEPQLHWDVDEDGAHLVHLRGFPNIGIIADGKTPEEALHKLGDILTHVFMDACPEPEVHTLPSRPHAQEQEKA